MITMEQLGKHLFVEAEHVHMYYSCPVAYLV